MPQARRDEEELVLEAIRTRSLLPAEGSRFRKIEPKDLDGTIAGFGAR